MASEERELSFEVFAAKEGDVTTGVMMTVPCHCGLRQADTLRLNGNRLLAMQARSVLPLDFAELPSEIEATLSALARSGQRLAVGEFTAIGLLDAYWLDVVAREAQ